MVFIESKNTLWLVLGLVILVAAAYVVWQYVLPALAAGQLDAKKNEAKALYLKSLTVGKDADSYSYSYIENMGGYVVKTTLLKNGQRYEAILESPLAKREIFYLENTTILCVTFDGYESCSPVENNTKLRNYLKGMKGYFFSNEQFQANNDTVGLLISNGALTFDSAEKSSVDGKECNFIKYLIKK